MHTSIENEWHIYGPPGCGKTTYITKDATGACQSYGAEKVTIISFTKAAKSAFNFDASLPRPEVRTLHSVCYRMLGMPDIAEAHTDDFNEAYPHYSLGSDINPNVDYRADDFGSFRSPGDKLYTGREYLLATCTPRDGWPEKITEFDKAWSEFKTANKLMDFSDLINNTARNFDVFAGSPDVVFIDEAQDLSRAEIHLIRQLCGDGKTARYVFAMDDDQTIYSFKGSSPEDLIGQISDERKHFLEQSWRVPRKIQGKAESWIERVAVRENKTYNPRAFDGEIRHCDATYRDPEPMIRSLEDYLDKGKTVMILVTCKYMLDNIIAVLARRGIPFHNPYRENRYEWNPLSLPGHRISDADRIKALLCCDTKDYSSGVCDWTTTHLKLFASQLSASVFTRDIAPQNMPAELALMCSLGSEVLNGQKLLEALPGGYPVDEDLLGIMFQPEHLVGLLSDARLDWYDHNLLPSRKKWPTMKFALNVCRLRGPDFLAREPQVIVGTVHSVKGGEADVVYLFPDLSTSGFECWTGNREKVDSVRRIMYVAMTRAKESLVVCEPFKPKFSVDGL